MNYRNLTNEEVSAIKLTDTAKLRQMIQARLRCLDPKKDWQRSEKYETRATHKLAWFLKAGYRLVTPELDSMDVTANLGLLSHVTKNEYEMSDREFYANWTDERAHIRRRIRIEKGLIPDETGKLIVKQKRSIKKTVRLTCQKCNEIFPAIRRNTKFCSKCGGPPDPTKRYCALGEQCFRSEKGKPRECLTKSPYCSDTCLGAFQASIRRSRELARFPLET